ncbi:MAG: hypothetical protein R3C05_19110 [Pirellulaceae bacterium]
MKILRMLLLTSICLGTAVESNADWDSFWHHKQQACHECKIDFLRNQCWPYPFREFDSEQTRDPFRTMASNGWRLHHTLSHEVFRPNDAMLTAVGRNRVHWIATQTPEHRRMIYVLQGESREETRRRVESVEAALAHVVVNGPPPQVFVTDRVPSLGSGEWSANLSRMRLEKMIAPMLPSAEDD